MLTFGFVTVSDEAVTKPSVLILMLALSSVTASDEAMAKRSAVTDANIEQCQQLLMLTASNVTADRVCIGINFIFLRFIEE